MNDRPSASPPPMMPMAAAAAPMPMMRGLAVCRLSAITPPPAPARATQPAMKNPRRYSMRYPRTASVAPGSAPRPATPRFLASYRRGSLLRRLALRRRCGGPALLDARLGRSRFLFGGCGLALCRRRLLLFGGRRLLRGRRLALRGFLRRRRLLRRCCLALRRRRAGGGRHDALRGIGAAQD